jgi:hypothetical protein
VLPNITYLKALADAIRDFYGTRVLHLQTAALQTGDNIPWAGNVEVFALMGPSESRRCFAWPSANGEAVVLLSTPEITTPEQAVRAYYSSSR